MFSDKARVIAACKEAVKMTLDTDGLEREYDRLTEQLKAMTKQIHHHVNKNQITAQDQQAYRDEYERLAMAFNPLKMDITEIEDELELRKDRHVELMAYLEVLEGTDSVLTKFSERLWIATVDTVTVRADRVLVFRFKDGREARWQ